MLTGKSKLRVIFWLVLITLLLGASSCALADDSIDYKNWMRNLPGFIPVSEINMPGTHDSGTRYMRSMEQDDAQCQDKNIKEQLEMGMRVLDLRLDENGGKSQGAKTRKLMLNHNGWDCKKDDSVWADALLFEDVLEDVGNFLHEHPSETVILYCAAEGDDGDDAKYILYDFIKDFRYNRKAAPDDGLYYPKGWDYFIYAYMPGDPVPTLDEVRGYALIIPDSNETDAKDLPEQRGGTTYEMNYKLKAYLGGDMWNKVKYIRKLLEYPIYKDCTIRYCESDFSQWPTFRKENKYYNGNDEGKTEGNPDVKYSGTNVTALDGPADWFKGADGPRECAVSFWAKLKEEDLLFLFRPGYRFGWITMDFPEMYPEFTDAIIRSNYTDTPYKYSVHVENIPSVKKEDIKISIQGPGRYNPKIIYETDDNGRVCKLRFDFVVYSKEELKDLHTVVTAEKDGAQYEGRYRTNTVGAEKTEDITMWHVTEYTQSVFLIEFDASVQSQIPKNESELLKQIGTIRMSKAYTNGRTIGGAFVSETSKNEDGTNAYLTDFHRYRIILHNEIYEVTVNAPKYDPDGDGPFTYWLEGIVNKPADSPYDMRITQTADGQYKLYLSAKAGGGDLPKTGDPANPVLWAVLLVGTAALAVVLTKRRLHE